MRTLTQTVTIGDFRSGYIIDLIDDCISKDSITGDTVTIKVIDDCPVVDMVYIPDVTGYNDGAPIFPTSGGDWMELNGCLRAVVSIHLIRRGYNLFVYGRHQIRLVPA